MATRAAEIKIQKVPGVKLSQPAYESLCAILESAPRLPFTKGQGKQRRVPWSHCSLAQQYGVSQNVISAIARSVRAGTHRRLYGVRATAYAPGGGYVTGVSVPAYEGKPAIRAHLSNHPMLEFLLNGAWQP